MATTANYGWTTPDDTDLVKDGASAIRTLGSAIDTTVKANADATGLVHINTTSFSAVTAQSVNDVFNSTYDRYFLIFDITCNTAADRPMLRLRASGTDTTTGYQMANVGRTSTGVALDTQAANGLYIEFNGFENLAINDTNMYAIEIQNPAKATRTSTFFENIIWSDNTRASHMKGGALLNNSTVYDGFTIQRVGAAGTFTGSVTTYGFKK